MAGVVGSVTVMLRRHVNVLGSVSTSRAPRMSLRMQGVVRFLDVSMNKTDERAKTRNCK